MLLRLAACDLKLAFRRSGVLLVGVGAATAAMTLGFEPVDLARRGVHFSSQSFVDTSLLLASVGAFLVLQGGSEFRDRFERSRCRLPLVATLAAILGRSAGLAVITLAYSASITLIRMSLGHPMEPYSLLRLILIAVLAAVTVGAWSSAAAAIRRSDVRNAVGLAGLVVLVPRLRDAWPSLPSSQPFSVVGLGEPWLPAALSVAGVVCLALAVSPRLWAGLKSSHAGTPRSEP